MVTVDPGRVVGIGGLLLATYGVYSVSMPRIGLAFGLGMMAVWVVSTPLAFAAAHFGLLAVGGFGSTLDILTVETGLILALIGPSVDRETGGILLVSTAAGLFGVFAIIATGYSRTVSLWVLAGIIGVPGAVVSYLLGRYADIRLGNVQSSLEG